MSNLDKAVEAAATALHAQGCPASEMGCTDLGEAWIARGRAAVDAAAPVLLAERDATIAGLRAEIDKTVAEAFPVLTGEIKRLRAELETIRATRTTVYDLAVTLASIEGADTDYDKRYGLVLNALAQAHALGFPAGIGIDPAGEPGFQVVVYIELPAPGGQISWHMPQHPTDWDGHTTDVKYERCRAWTDEHLPF